MKLLKRSGFRYLLRHPWQAVLSILGIALGVAVVLAIDVANQSASRAFKLSMESIAGKSTHQITGGTEGIPDSLYRYLRIQKSLRPSAPVIEKYITLPGNPSRTFTLFGIDPFAERPFRSYLSGLGAGEPGSLNVFLTIPGAVLISENTALRTGVHPGDTLSIRAGGIKKQVILAGLISPQDEYSRNALENIMITDISTAQELFEMPGRLSRIDLIIPEDKSGERMLNNIRRILPEEFSIIRSETRSQVAADMVKAFDINLTALSLLALIVGTFLIYNAMTFSVVQRRTQIGLLRSLGVTRREIFSSILSEAFLLGLSGTVLGTFAGIVLAKGMVSLIAQTINDLYFVLYIKELFLDPLSLVKAASMGIGATLLAALRPAREATNAPARIVMSRSVQETSIRKKIPWFLLAAVVSIAAGILILRIPGNSIFISYVGILPIILGFTFLTPLIIILIVKVTKPLFALTFGILGRMAGRGVITQMSRTAVAIAALGISVSAVVGVGTMISSFRQTVVQWLESSLSADIYISPPSLVSRRMDAVLDTAFVRKVMNLNGIDGFNAYREIQLYKDNKMMHIVGLRIDERSYGSFKFKEGIPETVWRDFQDGQALIVTEPYAYRNNIRVGNIIKIPTDLGERNFRVAGIYYDYASDLGLVAMSMKTFRRYWTDPGYSGISLFVKKEANSDSLMDAVRNLTGPDEEVLVRSNNALRSTSIEVFDRTFLITYVLQILAIIVAFAGILSSLMALQLERTRELGILRANGLTPKQLWRLVTIQTGLMGFIAGILSIPLGSVLAWILIYIINKRSFGWTLQFEFIPGILLQAIIISVVAALLAGIYPGIKMARTSPAAALREE